MIARSIFITELNVIPMPEIAAFESLGRLPTPGDNAAVAIRRIEPGTEVLIEGSLKKINTTILEGHRFAYKTIAKDEAVLSWGLPFGTALKTIEAGESIINELSLQILSQRDLGNAVLPKEANFKNSSLEFKFNENEFKPGKQIELNQDKDKITFEGYLRDGGRGTGTRNFIVVLGTSSMSAYFARALADRVQSLAKNNTSFNGIVSVAHTEGGSHTEPHNKIQLLKALAGFIVHPNVGAILIADHGSEAINNKALKQFMLEKEYPLQHVLHEFISVEDNLNQALEDGKSIIASWIPKVSSYKRTTRPVAELKMGLQCGGSDAFSGISANPLIGAIGRELVRNGGFVNLAETDELIGAETYILKNVKDAQTVKAFLEKQKLFRERLGWHGSTIEGNPSGGNRLRGLYNIFLKSLGAATKKDPSLRLDQVIDYAEPMIHSGFTFMNSPGNDLESVAGQVGAGCNVICFTTGNGSVTNFPFVPTIKVTSTTRRHTLLKNEMDINAGAYLDGTPMDQLCHSSFNHLRDVASGKLTQGEKAGHYQVSIWRNWSQTDTSQLELIKNSPKPNGKPTPILNYRSELTAPPVLAFQTNQTTWANERVGLIVASSMCSSQIARLAAEYLTSKKVGASLGINRFVALAHSEGCGFAGEAMYALMQRTLSSYARHPNAISTLFLEHGCEKIPNDAIRLSLKQAGVDPARYGWASVQLDGGIDLVIKKIEQWFNLQFGNLSSLDRIDVGIKAISLALLCDTEYPNTHLAESFGKVAHAVVSSGGKIFIAESDPLLKKEAFTKQVLAIAKPVTNLAYGEFTESSGFYIVATETSHFIENLAGLGGCGAQLALSIKGNQVRPNHPLIPLLQISDSANQHASDLVLKGSKEDAQLLLDMLCLAYSSSLASLATRANISDFQLTRGLLGVST